MTTQSVLHNKKLMKLYAEKTRSKADGKDSLNPICGKYLFARVDTVFSVQEKKMLKRIEHEYFDFENAIVQLFMFSELEYVAKKAASPEFAHYVERGDFSFIESLIEGFNSSSIEECREFCDSVFFGVPTIDFIINYKLLNKNIRNLKHKYAKQQVSV